MNTVKLLRLDASEDAEFQLTASETVIGRGSVLGCYDKRISRNHGRLRILGDESIELISTHTNPCFYKENNLDEYSVLNKEETKILYIGDEFALLPCSYRYRFVKLHQEPIVKDGVEFVMPTENAIIINATPNVSTLSSSSSGNQNMASLKLKRAVPTWLSDMGSGKCSPQKTVKLEPDNLTVPDKTEEFQGSHNIPNTLSNDILKDSTLKTDVNSIMKVNPVGLTRTLHNVSDEDTKEGYEEDVVDDASDDPVLASGSTIPNPGSSTSREACLYGKECFRKNAEHHKDFSHPGDSDYSDIANSQDKPECQYGTSCYRKNLQHRKDFKHTKRAQRQTQIPPLTSNVYCHNCTINYFICSQCHQTTESLN